MPYKDSYKGNGEKDINYRRNAELLNIHRNSGSNKNQ